MSETLTGNSNISHYRIISKLGAGGMGEVYLAEDSRLRRKIALKVLPENIAKNKDRLRRFEQEAFAASALNHPNIVTIYEISELNGTRCFIAMEFVEGSNVHHLIKERKLKLDETLDIAIQTASALAAAHAVGIVHRDIKPENIMRRPDG
ncbi:MAG TPA: serine/threonine-protein kinase, partial [Pyrinomonadaceae bacterium]|nr:serine/threonine-protein kinase [Pyrinomonadaceae bacterium]